MRRTTVRWPFGAGTTRATEAAGQLTDSIIDLAERQLGIAPLAPDDSLGLLGVSSLEAERLLRELRRQLSIRVSAADLVGDPSISDLALAIERRRRKGFRDRTDVTEFRTPADAPADVHLIAGAGASTTGFVPLASALPSSFAVRAYQARGLESRGVPEWTIGQAVRWITRAIEATAEPGRPRVIIGHSFGGHIATEVTRRLRRRGSAVHGLILLDPAPRFDDTRSIADFAGDFSEDAPSARQRAWSHVTVATAGLVQFDAATHQSALWERGVRAQNRYEITALPPLSTLFISADNVDKRFLWEPHLERDSAVVEVAGSHNDILSGAGQLAAITTTVAAYLADVTPTAEES